MPHFCGLCKKEVGDWGEHVKSEEHQKNLATPQKVSDAFIESQARAVALIKTLEAEGKK